METASFSIPPAEELDKFDDEQIVVASQGVANALFHLKPPPEEVRDTLAAFFRYLAEKRTCPWRCITMGTTSVRSL